MFTRDWKWMRVAVLLFLLMLAFSPMLATAASIIPTIVPQECNQQGGCPSVCSIAQLAQNILNAAIYLAVFVSAILFAWAGLRMMTSVADPSGRSAAKSIFTNVAIGLVIILAGWLVVDTVMKTLVDVGKFGPWNKVCVVIFDALSHGVGLA